jgi:hypothetical protein
VPIESSRTLIPTAAVALLALTSFGPAAAPADPVAGNPTAGAAQTCDGAGWTVRDDGGFENAIGWSNTVTDGLYVDRFDFGSGSDDIFLRACVHLTRAGTDDSVDLALIFWSLDGPGGDPGKQLGSKAAVAKGVPTFPLGQSYEYDVTSLRLLAQGEWGVGMRWNPQLDPGIFIAIDESPGTAFTDPMGSDSGGVSWDSVLNGIATIRTTSIRVQTGPDPTIFDDGFESGDTSFWSGVVF